MKYIHIEDGRAYQLVRTYNKGGKTMCLFSNGNTEIHVNANDVDKHFRRVK